MSLFRFDRVTVDSLRGPILHAIEAEIPARGITVIVGPSGAGKTTLLRLCNRLDVPTRGRVFFRDRDVSELDPQNLRRRVGMVFQRPSLFGGTVRDNLRVAAPDAGDTEFTAVLERAELSAGFLDRPADELSGGEGQRVCIARTLVTEPEVLLMDEPTSALDRTPRLGLERLARGLADAEVPVVWVTHQLDQMRRLADQVLVLVAGRARFGGPVSDLERVSDVDVSELLADAPEGAPDGS